jgi:hypothetical protein
MCVAAEARTHVNEKHIFYAPQRASPGAGGTALKIGRLAQTFGGDDEVLWIIPLKPKEWLFERGDDSPPAGI